MRLSIETLLILARAGDRSAHASALFLDYDRSAEAWVYAGRIGAGWPGVGGFHLSRTF